MDNKLKALFDYQKFKGNTKLARLIADTESRYAKELSDDDISMVSAAGDPFAKFAEDGEESDDISN